MHNIYESSISDKKRLTLGLLSDVGWLMYFAGMAIYMINGADGLGTVVLSVTFLLNWLCILAILVGIIGLISQRIRKLGRRLTKSQLVIGFGLIICGSFAGFLFSGAAAAMDLLFHYETRICFASQCMMAAGALVCFAFGLPILRSFISVEK